MRDEWVSLARGLSRKEFLKLGGAGLVAGTGLLGVAGCGGNSSGKYCNGSLSKA